MQSPRQSVYTCPPISWEFSDAYGSSISRMAFLTPPVGLTHMDDGETRNWISWMKSTSGAVYCNRSCLFVCLLVCLFVGLLPR